MDNFVSLYGHDGRLLGKLCLDTGRAQIGYLFYAVERTCERLARGDSRDLYTYWVCSECNSSMPSPSNYCPNCGARVKEVTDAVRDL